MRISCGSPEQLDAVVGEAATGEWFEIDQDRIQAFADATGDWQWIHVDAERAAAGPFRGTVAHGYLLLSLIPMLTAGLIGVGGTDMVVNYGLDRVRFLEPVRAGARVRAVSELTSVERTSAGVRGGIRVTIEIEGTERAALVADTIALFVRSAEHVSGSDARALLHSGAAGVAAH